MNSTKIIVLLLFCKIFANSALKNTKTIKLESAQRTYVNNKLIDHTVDAVPFNKTCNYLNMTIKFKYEVKENIWCDADCYRLINNNRSFPIGSINLNWKNTITMEQFGCEAMWIEYTRPPLVWPPRANVTYHTFGWAPDMNKFPPTLISGKVKVSMTLMLLNHTRLFSSDWIFNIF